MTDEEQTPWMAWVIKSLIIIMLTIIPVSGILFLFGIAPWIPADWASPTILLSGLVMLIGSGYLLSTREIRVWFYSIVIGYAIGIGSIGLYVAQGLTLIPVPFFGNAFYAVLTLVTGIVFAIGWLWPMNKSPTTGLSSDVIATSPKSIGQNTVLGGSLFDRKEEKVLAVGLIEIPHEYVYADDGNQVLLDIIEKSHSVARTLTKVPFGWNIQRVKGVFRVIYFTFSKDEMRLEHNRTRLYDALNQNLRGFGFDIIDSYTGPLLREDEVGSVAIITGVPLSIKDEGQKRDPLEAMTGVLQDIENGMFQVFIEPYELSGSKLRSLENDYRREVERSETTVSKESSGWLGTQQESKTTVNAKAKRSAEILERQLKRLSNPNLHKVTVTVLSWSRKIESADLNTRRITSALIGCLRPDNEQDEFQVKFRQKRKDLLRLMKGLPVGDSSILTSDEVAGYLIPPQKDMTIRVTKREKFSSGTKASQELAERKDDSSEMVTSKVPSNVQWVSRTPQLHLGNPIDESGKVLPNLHVTTDIKDMDMHLGVFGNTRSGKSTTVLNVIGQTITLGVNPVVLVPSKAYEWRALMNVFQEMRVFTCGRSDIANLVINIWDPPEGVQISKWVDRVVQVWTLWLPNDKVISMHVEDVIYTVYKNCDWDLRANTKGRPILLDDLVDAVREVSERLDYGDEVSSNVYGALVARVKSILRKPALVDMLNTPTGLTISELLAHPTVIDMDALSENDKVLLIGILTAAISEYKLANPSKKVTNLLVLEEAHYLLSRTDNAGEANSGVRLQAINAFVQMLRVLGGTGLGVILIDQSPTTLVPQAIKVLVNLVIHALADEEDRKLVGKHARCTDLQIEHIGGMQVGEAVVYLQYEGEPKNVSMFVLSEFIRDKLPGGSVDDATVRKHMKVIFGKHPELEDSKLLPDDIIDRLRIQKRSVNPKNHSPKMSGPEERVKALEESLADYRYAIEKIVETPEYGDYTNKCIKEENPRALLKLIQVLSRNHCKGTKESDLFVLLVTMGQYVTEENEHVFHEIAKMIDGENTE